MSTKALSQLFLLLTIINIPVYVFYHNSNPIEVTKPEFLGVFSSFSLGNIAERAGSCDAVNFAIGNEINLKCSYGSLENIMYYGFAKEDDASCLSIRSSSNSKSYFTQECYKEYAELKAADSEAEAKRIAVGGKLEAYYYKNCYGKSKCTIKIDTDVTQLLALAEAEVDIIEPKDGETTGMNKTSKVEVVP